MAYHSIKEIADRLDQAMFEGKGSKRSKMRGLDAKFLINEDFILLIKKHYRPTQGIILKDRIGTIMGHAQLGTTMDFDAY